MDKKKRNGTPSLLEFGNDCIEKKGIDLGTDSEGDWHEEFDHVINETKWYGLEIDWKLPETFPEGLGNRILEFIF